jgi:hypothetical protein
LACEAKREARASTSETDREARLLVARRASVAPHSRITTGRSRGRERVLLSALRVSSKSFDPLNNACSSRYDGFAVGS